MNAKINIAVTGASGRMGQALIRAIDENPNTNLSGALEREGADAIGKDSGLLAAIGENNQRWYLLNTHHGIAHIIGTTGCSEVQDLAIARAAETTAIMKSGNMSMGVIMLSVLVERAAKALASSDWDIEVLEMHHKHKVDAPSGTALLLGNSAAQGRSINLADNSVRTRDGITGARVDGTSWVCDHAWWLGHR
ncbi:4-hydroxy-tetrahydrodipicolinate reductase [Nymphon striatum]|nr:4-hydroxy-tetrahydrodipicolinate reductase [Nymphon striatum]